MSELSADVVTNRVRDEINSIFSDSTAILPVESFISYIDHISEDIYKLKISRGRYRMMKEHNIDQITIGQNKIVIILPYENITIITSPKIAENLSGIQLYFNQMSNQIIQFNQKECDREEGIILKSPICIVSSLAIESVLLLIDSDLNNDNTANISLYDIIHHEI